MTTISITLHYPPADMPDADTDVLVFDASSPEAQLGAYVGQESDGPVWVNAQGEIITDVVVAWAEMPVLGMTDHTDIVERLNYAATNTYTVGIGTRSLCAQAAAEITRLRAEAAELRSVMIAAAEEIQAHWPAHCDDEGYGPANLMRRLEEGIPSQYAYTAGDFERLRAEAEALRKALQEAVHQAIDYDGFVRESLGPQHWIPKAIAAIDATKGTT